jgi:hypothetical protein
MYVCVYDSMTSFVTLFCNNSITNLSMTTLQAESQRRQYSSTPSCCCCYCCWCGGGGRPACSWSSRNSLTQAGAQRGHGAICLWKSLRSCSNMAEGEANRCGRSIFFYPSTSSTIATTSQLAFLVHVVEDAHRHAAPQPPEQLGAGVDQHGGTGGGVQGTEQRSGRGVLAEEPLAARHRHRGGGGAGRRGGSGLLLVCCCSGWGSDVTGAGAGGRSRTAPPARLCWRSGCQRFRIRDVLCSDMVNFHFE